MNQRHEKIPGISESSERKPRRKFAWRAFHLAWACLLAISASAQLPPTILSNNPAIGATGVPVSSPTVFYFSTNMNTTLTRAQFMNGSIPPPNNITVTASWNATGTQLTNSPTPTFPAGKAILWFLSGVDAWDRPLTGTVNGGFLTAASGTVTLISVTPTNQAINVATNASVQFIFSGAMDTNATTAQFSELSDPTTPLPVTKSWSPNKTILTLAPSPSFPPGKVILWNLQGQGATGEAFPYTGGVFTTAGSPIETNITFTAILSRGEVAEQIEATLFQIQGQEFCALADAVASQGIAFAAPAQTANTLSRAGTSNIVEFIASDREPIRFATNFAAGNYELFLDATGAVSTAMINLADGLLPPPVRTLNWPAHAVLGQPQALLWILESGGAAADYVRLRIEQGGRLVFATPLPGAPGALNASSNMVIVPPDVFTNAGLAEVRVTAFTFTARDTNSIPGLTLYAARHRSTAFELNVVDGATPPPILRTTNLNGICVGEPFLHPLRTTNGARPFHFTLLSGSLPPGLELEPEGAISGMATVEGTFDATLRISDVLGQNMTQTVQIVTTAVPVVPTFSLENAGRGPGSTIQFDVVGTAGADWRLDRSTNLVNWAPYLTANSPAGRLTLQAPISGEAAFFRVLGAGTQPPPNPLTVAPVLNPGITNSATIGFFGGTLALTNTAGYEFSLNVPVGALDRDELITMTDIAQIGGLPLSGGMNAAVDLQPEGLLFYVPARLDITAPAAIDPKTIFGFGSRRDGSQFALRYSFITNRTVSLYLRHFTTGGSGSGNSTDGQGQTQNPPNDPWEAAEQDLESMRQQCLQDDCDPDSLRASQVKYYIQMADQDVLPLLKAAAESGEDSLVDDALTTYMTWRKGMELLAISEGQLNENIKMEAELASRATRALGLASTAISKSMAKACKDCLNHDLARLQRMLDLATQAELLGWNLQNTLLECYRKCMVFELKLDSEIFLETQVGLLITHTKSTVKLQRMDSGDEWLLYKRSSFEGAAEWKITSAVHFENPCPISKNPASGTLQILKATIFLGKGDPRLEVFLAAGISFMVTEGRTMTCENQPPQPVGDIYGPTFLVLHDNEVIYPEPGTAEEAMLGGPAVKISGFEQSASDVIFSKEINRSESGVTEITTIELRHTPR